MKKLKFALAALILTSALAFTGCRDAGDDSAGQNNGQVESNGSNVFLAAAVPNTSEALTALNPDISSMPGLEGSFTSEPEVSSVPQGNCPDCNGTGHHNNTVCGTCNGSGWCAVQSHHKGGHHQNRSHH